MVRHVRLAAGAASCLLVGLAGCAPAGGGKLATSAHFCDGIDAESIRTDIAELASDEMNGRFWRSEDGWRAARWVAARFADAGLEPLPGRADMFVPVTDDAAASPNVVAWMPPALRDGAKGSTAIGGAGRNGAGRDASGPGMSGPDVTGPVVAISAHYDHLRPARQGADRIFNGADDNASGVCAMIAVAHALQRARAHGHALGSGILFIAFTGEESGLIGSRAFVRDGTVPTDLMRALLNMDMVSRSDDGAIRVDGGTVGAPVTAMLVRIAPEVGLPLVVDTHPEWLPRSDQGPFLARGVPSVLLSVEDHEDYHTVRDEVDRIDADLAARTARLVCRTVDALAR
jgi:hypothetical protein